MDGWKETQEGSPSRDRFKFLHKEKLGNSQYALDADLELVEKFPIPFIVARLDFKCKRDHITFTEGIAYNEYSQKLAPIYIIEAQHSSQEFLELEPESHRFHVYYFISADWRPHPVTAIMELIESNLTWEQLALWEFNLRQARKKEVRKVAA